MFAWFRIAAVCAAASVAVLPMRASAQDAHVGSPAEEISATGGDWAWRPVVETAGVRVRYLFYPEADNHNNGVVLRLDNANPYAIEYRFTVIFRGSEDAVREAPVTGRLGAGKSVTGDADGLFFIPFTDGEVLHEFGLRGYRVVRLPTDS